MVVYRIKLAYVICDVVAFCRDSIYYIHLSLSIFLTVYPCLDFRKLTGTSKFPFREMVVHLLFEAEVLLNDI
jgi:hypothetical protein